MSKAPYIDFSYAEDLWRIYRGSSSQPAYSKERVMQWVQDEWERWEDSLPDDVVTITVALGITFFPPVFCARLFDVTLAKAQSWKGLIILHPLFSTWVNTCLPLPSNIKQMGMAARKEYLATLPSVWGAFDHWLNSLASLFFEEFAEKPHMGRLKRDRSFAVAYYDATQTSLEFRARRIFYNLRSNRFFHPTKRLREGERNYAMALTKLGFSDAMSNDHLHPTYYEQYLTHLRATTNADPHSYFPVVTFHDVKEEEQEVFSTLLRLYQQSLTPQQETLAFLQWQQAKKEYPDAHPLYVSPCMIPGVIVEFLPPHFDLFRKAVAIGDHEEINPSLMERYWDWVSKRRGEFYRSAALPADEVSFASYLKELVHA